MYEKSGLWCWQLLALHARFIEYGLGSKPNAIFLYEKMPTLSKKSYDKPPI